MLASLWAPSCSTSWGACKLARLVAWTKRLVYAEYLKTITEVDNVPPGEMADQATRNAFQIARIRMTAYASGAVLAAAANLERARNEVAFEKYVERLKDLYQAKRDDTRGKGDDADRQDLDMLLWGRDSKEWAKEWTAIKQSTEKDL